MTESLGDFDKRTAENHGLRDANLKLQKQLREAKDRTRNLVDATYDGARDAMLALGPVDKVTRPKLKGSGPGGEEAALWHLSDWQGAKVTTSYNSQVMRQRVMRFCEKAAHITEIQRAAHPVQHCTIMFGGDMLEGIFNFPNQVFEIDATIFEQYVTVARLELDVVRFALSVYDTVEVVAEWGNHGRIGSKRAAVPVSDNFDRMSYEMARQMAGDEPRLVWADCPEDIQNVEIGNYRALLIHGDEVGRNGFASVGTIVQHVNRWRSGAHKAGSWRSGHAPWEFKDVYVGHYHTHNTWAMANGEGSVYQTGSTESDNRYAGVNLASSAIPSQRLHFVDPERGRVTAEYKVWLNEEGS